MPQLTLFDSTETLLADDERGRIAYTPRFVDAATAKAWFEELRSGVNWRGERRMMYDREVEVPRLMGLFRLDTAPDSIPGAIRAAARRVTDRLGVPFNSVGLNLYRNGHDSVAPHNDHLNEIRKGFPIALVSLGATRRMTIRAKDRGRDPGVIKDRGRDPGVIKDRGRDPGVIKDRGRDPGVIKDQPRRLIHVDLEPGSLLVMDYATQLHYTHGVPKTTEVVGERISLAFRVKRARAAPADDAGSGFYR